MPGWLAIKVMVELNINVGDHELFCPEAISWIVSVRWRSRNHAKLHQRDDKQTN